jgi:hypothetical protein
MKHLAIASFKDSAATLPPSIIRPLLEATITHMKQQSKAGKVQEAYFIPGWNRFVVIGETASVEEIVKNQSDNALLGLMSIEVYPLADLDESMKSLLKAVKMAEKVVSTVPK